MVDDLAVWIGLGGAIAGTGHAVAAVVREWFHGRAALVRAERGVPELLILKPSPVEKPPRLP